MTSNNLPAIAMLPHDMSRLDLLTGRIPLYRCRIRRMLARELARARVLSTADTPRDLVTMHSTVRFRDDDTERIQTAMLVYPGEEVDDPGTVSVLTPVGCALIGLSEGQSIHYEADDGRPCRLTVLQVLAQSEAHRPKLMPVLGTVSQEDPSDKHRRGQSLAGAPRHEVTQARRERHFDTSTDTRSAGAAGVEPVPPASLRETKRGRLAIEPTPVRRKPSRRSRKN